MSELVDGLLQINNNYDRKLLEFALEKATELHKDQKRKSGEPYIIHPIAVARILADLGMDDHTIAAGLLHDVVEDTVYTIDDVERDFGKDIAIMVDGVTKLTNIVYSSKEEQQAENIRKMFLAMSQDIRVLVIKLCDRMHNMRTINFQTPQKIEEKCKETLEIYAPLAARLGMYKFKFEFEDIAFKNLYKDDYEKLDKELSSRNSIRTAELENLKKEIQALLDSLNIDYKIFGRNKHYYSIYKKMSIQHKGLDEIFDLTALRIIVNNVNDCYAALGAVHTKWKPIPGRFKDYIAMPKANKYQSLHTTVISENGIPFEIQIRTWEMHEVAEYGIAAHWKYKEGITGSSNNEEVKLAWLRQTLEWQKEMKDSSEFVETLKVDLFSNQVYVFTPKGDVMELPAGSTPLDFAYKIHTRIGEKCVGAKVNGKMVPINYILKNGEIIDIVTNTNSKGPNIDWLKIVKTNSARNKIRQYLNKENKIHGSDRGKDMLEKACRKKDFNPELVLKSTYVLKAAKAQGFISCDDLYAAISMGGTTISKTLMLCLGYYREDEEIRLNQEERIIKKAVLQQRQPKANKGVDVKGVNNLLIRFARCCNPVPGDEIIGYTTKGRGVSIHRKDCINMLSLPENEQIRLISVSWNIENSNMLYDVSITILCDDRKGLVADISKVCEDLDFNIVGIKAHTDGMQVCNISLTLQISSTNDMEKLISRLKQIKDVIDVYRTSY